MKSVITINTSNGKSVTIFTQHITYIEHSPRGCTLHINGGENVAITTGYKWEELKKALGLR